MNTLDYFEILNQQKHNFNLSLQVQMDIEATEILLD